MNPRMNLTLERSIVIAAGIVSVAAIVCTWMVTHVDDFQFMEKEYGWDMFNRRTGERYAYRYPHDGKDGVFVRRDEKAHKVTGKKTYPVK